MLLTSDPNVQVVEFYFGKFDQIKVNPIIFAEFTVILLAVFIIRWLMLYKFEKAKSTKNLKTRLIYMTGHCLFEILIAYVVCYCLIKLTNANPESYIINMIIAPAVGVILSFYLDNKFLIPLEQSSVFGNLVKKSKTEKKSDVGNNVTINIGENNSRTLPEGHYIDESLADSDDFNSEIIKTINGMFINQERNTKALADLKESLMIDKKIILKQMIYNCLNKNFATPEENDKITQYYHAYHDLLGGNHEVTELYENHYLKKVDVHEERRVNRMIYYGELDGGENNEEEKEEI